MLLCIFLNCIIYIIYIYMELNNYDVIIIGCGLSGIVIAERFASLQNKKILIIDKRNHIGGNCYDYYDEETNILMNKYGAHLFHTNDEEVFKYINKFSKWNKWEHKVLGLIDDKYVPIPANITTVNEIFNLNIKTKKEMDKWLSENQVKYDKIINSEEMAKSRVGETLYEKIFKHYTYKQWKKYPDELAPEVLARIPVRNSFDDRYFSDKYQVLPEKGYTAFFQSILDKYKKNIDVKLNCDFFDIKDKITKDHIVIYTGPIDAYFADKGLPKLEYRSIDFHIERKMNTESYQPYSVVNYPSADTPYTRCVEYKHFLNQKSDHTVYVKETTTDTGEPYYPVLNDKNKELYAKYQKMAEKEEKNIHFIGRLASYKYFNMDQAIKNSLDYYEEHFKHGVEESNSGKKIFSVFSGRERYMRILSVYIDKLLDQNIIDEVNIWDFIKNDNDREYINNLCKKDKYFLKIPDNSTGGPWDGYYKYYYENLNDEDILIKCDDDIIYIDVNTFEDYLGSVKNGNFYYPNIVNNDVCAYYQQKYNVHNLFDYDVNFEKLSTSYCSSPVTTWENGWYKSFEKASQSHKMFLINPNQFKLKNKPLERYNSRISINMFACTGVTAKKHFMKVIIHKEDDEAVISALSQAGNIINLNCSVVHFQFGPQKGNILDELYLDSYYKFAISSNKNNNDVIVKGDGRKESFEVFKNNNDVIVKGDGRKGSFEVFKKDGVLNFIDNGCWETRNPSTIWCIQQANKLYKWSDFDKIVISTGDIEHNNAHYSYSHQKDISKTIPDFNFHAWPQVGINDYSSFVNDIHLSGLNPPKINKVGWIGNLKTNYKRKIVYNIGLQNTDCMEIFSMSWSKSGDNIKLNSTKYISTPDLVKKYAILIDIEGSGYSGRVKHLLWSHRPLIIVNRSHKEYFYKYLEPWKHFIPVKNDLSDLVTNIKWCLQNKNKAIEIAENAYDFSKKYLTREACYNRWDEIISNKIIRTDLYKKNIDPLIKIYCDKRKRVWFKDLSKCNHTINNPNTYIIYTDKMGKQKVLPGIDYVGPDLNDVPCNNLEQAKKYSNMLQNIDIKNCEPIIKIYCDKRKRVWFKDIAMCKKIIKDPNTHIIYTDKMGKQIVLPGVDYEGPSFHEKSCNNLEFAKIMEENSLIKIYCDKRKRVWFKDITICNHIINNPNTHIIYTDKMGKQIVLSGVDYEGPDFNETPCNNLQRAKNLTIIDNAEFYFYIRGHIRNSFNTNRLKNFIQILKLYFPNIKFILQTWKHKECKNNESWRRIKENNNIISEQVIQNYFQDKNITKQCLIIDEKSIKLVGPVDGKLTHRTACPKRGWKNMWYGIYKGLEHLNVNLSNYSIVSFRYDYFEIPQNNGICEGNIIQFIKNNLNNKNIQFIINDKPGCDNLYIGKYNKIKTLIERFHFNLEDIINTDKNMGNQEKYVCYIAKTI